MFGSNKTIVGQIKTIALGLCLILLSQQIFAEPIVLRFAYADPPESPEGQIATKFQQLVKDNIGNNAIVVETYPKGFLFNDEQLVPAVFNNRIDITVVPVSSLQPYFKRIQLFELPFLFISEKAASRFLKGEYGQRILKLMELRGAIGVGYLDNGMKQLSTNKKVLAPQDAKNLKFLVTNSKIADFQFRQINARPIVADLNKADILLKNETADGQESTWSNIYNRRLHEVQPFILETNHAYQVDMILVSKSNLAKIAEPLRNKLMILLKQAIDHGNSLASKQAKYERQLILESGNTEITRMTVEERELWIEAMQDVWKQFSDDIGSELINAAASAR